FSPLFRVCTATAAILAAAAGGTFLFRGSVNDPIATAIAFARDVWAVAPDVAPPTGSRVENVPRNSSAIPAAAAPTAPGTPGPSIVAVESSIEHTSPRLATRSVPAITGSYVAVPRAATADDSDGVLTSVSTPAKPHPTVLTAVPGPVPKVGTRSVT